MNIYFVEKFSEGDTDQQLEAMRKYFTFTTLEEAEMIFCSSISVMQAAFSAKLQSSKPLAVYCWDYYLWAHEGKNESGNWQKYAEFLRLADLIFVPSKSQQFRLKELLGLNSVVVKTGILTYEHEVTDGGFILDPLRTYPDEQAGWAKRAAEELGIPFVHSEHQYSQEDFRKLVASCTFLTSTTLEASTGGLTLAEGLWLGKQSLVSNSPYMGARDYLGDFAMYFNWNEYKHLKHQMKMMWERRQTIVRSSARDYITKELSFEQMAKGLYHHMRTFST